MSDADSPGYTQSSSVSSAEPDGSHLGLEGARGKRLLADVLQIAATYRPLTDRLRWPGPEGSEVDRLDQLVAGTITVTDTLVASQRSARASVLHLTSLLESSLAPRASVAVTLSRAALLGATRIIYILGPSDPQSRVDHAQRVIRTQAGSHLKAIKTFSTFGSLGGLQAPTELVTNLQEVLDELPPGGVTDTEMVAKAAGIINDWRRRTGGDETSAALEDHLPWMWNAWSGVAHGWAWPKYVPGPSDPDRDSAPGCWILDFKVLAMVVHLALTFLADALKPLELGNHAPDIES